MPFLFHKTYNKGEKIKMWKIMSSSVSGFHRDTRLMLCYLLLCISLVLVFIYLSKMMTAHLFFLPAEFMDSTRYRSSRPGSRIGGGHYSCSQLLLQLATILLF